MTGVALSNLVCPATQSPLKLRTNETDGQPILEGRLEGDRESYAIREGIASFLAEAGDQTRRSFNDKWSRHRYYREHTGWFYTQWYLERYGFHDEKSLQNFLSGAKYILDAGTGSGRDAANFSRHSPAIVYAVDTSWEALAAAQKQIPDERIAFVHADLNQLPFADEFFDFINCDQVIHHTPAPREAFERLRRKLRTGGHICCYVYRKKTPLREFADDHLRAEIGSMSADEALALCEAITKLGRTLSKLNVTVNVEEDVPILGVKKGPIDLQRLFHWHVMKCFWNDEFDFFTNNIINFDWYHPHHCHRFEPDEFRAWFDDGWEIEAWNVQEAGISCRARKV